MSDERFDETQEESSADLILEDDGDIVQSNTDDEFASDDSLTFSNGVIEKIVALAVRDVPGVVGMKGTWFNRFQNTFGVDDTTKGVTVEVTPEAAVRINISVLIEYGAYAPQVFEDTKKAVVEQIAGMTGLEVAGVNLRIEDVLTEDEVERRNRARREVERNEDNLFDFEQEADELALGE